METLYQRIEYLCNQRRITITVMCKESGASRGSLTDLKKGRKQSLSSETLSKIAVYFNVTVDYLLTGEQKDKPPAIKTEGLSTQEMELIQLVRSMNVEGCSAVLNYAQFCVSNPEYKKYDLDDNAEQVG